MGRRILRHLRSHVIAYLALFFALTGTAMALPGTNSVDSGDIINGQVKSVDIANEKVNTNDLQDNQVRSSDVRDDTLTNGGLGASDLAPNSVGSSELNDAVQATSGAGQDASVVTLSGSGTNVASGQITTTGTSRLLVDASAELTGATSDERATCVVRLDGSTISLGYETTFDDIGANNEATVSVVTSQNNVSAGTHTVTMVCTSLAGTVVKDDAGINAIGIPAL